MPVDIASVDIFSSKHKQDPFAYYARLRSQTPVCQIKAPVFGKVWLITRYKDVVACLKDADRFVKDPRNAGVNHRKTMPRWLPASVKALEQNMLDTDDPGHHRLRSLVNQTFGRRRIDELKPRAEAIANDLIARISRAGTSDLLSNFAQPFPLLVICELLGVPVGDQHRFRKWSAAFLNSSSSLKMMLSLPATFAFIRYLRRLIRARRAEPRDDLITALVQAEEQGQGLNEHELIAMIMLLIIAGHETTVNLIASGTLALLENADQRQRLAEDPSLMTTAIDELLRFTGPVDTATERYATEDTEIGGVLLQRGDLVFPVIASANRDERQFTSPDRLDLARNPNPHIAFGDGVHFCLGHQLVKMEAEIAFGLLLHAFPRMKLAMPAAELSWRSTPIVRGLAQLPVAVS